MYKVLITVAAVCFSVHSVEINKNIRAKVFGGAGLSRKNNRFEGAYSGKFFDSYHDGTTSLLRNSTRTDNMSDNLIGINLNADIANKWAILAQAYGEGHVDDYEPKVDYAFLRYRVNSNINLSAGLLRTQSFLYSKYQRIGSLYPWITVPEEVYHIIPFDNATGIEYEQNFELNKNHTLKFNYMYYDSHVKYKSKTSEIDGQVNKGHSVSLELKSHDHVTFRTVYSKIEPDLTVYIGSKKTPARIFGMTTFTVFDYNLKKAKYFSASMKIDYKDLLFITERIRVDSENKALLNRVQAYYMTLGHYFFNQRLLPHVTFAKINHSEGNVNIIKPGQHVSYTYGLNYLINKNLTIKLEHKMFRTKNTASNLSDTAHPNWQSYNSANLNFIF